jgi:hypothetical protein
MNNVKVEQTIWLIIGTLFTAGMLYFVKDSTTITGIAWAFTSIVGTFIGIDLANMIKKTSEMSNGQYKPYNKPRYIMSVVIFALLLAESFFIASTGRNCDGLYASFGMGLLLMIGAIISGIEGNKVVTKP